MFGATFNLITRVGLCRSFWNTERLLSSNKWFNIKQLFQLQKRLQKWQQRFDWTIFVKKPKGLRSSDQTVLLKFH